MPRWPPLIFSPPRFTATGTTPSCPDSSQTDAVIRAQTLTRGDLLHLGLRFTARWLTPSLAHDLGPKPTHAADVLNLFSPGPTGQSATGQPRPTLTLPDRKTRRRMSVGS